MGLDLGLQSHSTFMVIRCDRSAFLINIDGHGILELLSRLIGSCCREKRNAHIISKQGNASLV